MKNLIVLLCTLALCGIATCDTTHTCYNATKEICNGNTRSNYQIEKCNSVYSGIAHALEGLQDYVYLHIIHSYKYLQMSTVFASYQRNRAGFEKFYKHLSDDTWEDTIDLIKYITKRGHKMDFNMRNRCTTNSIPKKINYCTSELDQLLDLDEIQSLSKALDLHKDLAHGAHLIHAEADKHHDNVHDPEVLSFLEEEFVHKHAKMIRTISGHLNDLIDMVHDTNDSEGNLAVYLFDDYLGKTI